MIEVWKPIVGWENFYEVSDQGRVRSLPRTLGGPYSSTRVLPGRELRQRDSRGYRSVTLCRDYRKTVKTVHRLVLETFVGPCPDGMVTCHGPGGPADNRLENLRWDTQSENVRDQLREGTHPSGATEDTCGRGHERIPANTYWKRGCRACDAITLGARRKSQCDEHVGTDTELGQQIAALFTEGA